MAYQGEFRSWTIQAQEDMRNLTPGTGALYKGVNFNTGLFANSGIGANGILQHAGGSEDHVSLAIDGVSKVVYSTAISTIGMPLTLTTSGFMTLAASGDYVNGHNLTTISCYGVGAAMINMINPPKFPG